LIILQKEEHIKINTLSKNKFNIGDHVVVYGFHVLHDQITALEFRKTDKVWCYQVGRGKWWEEGSLKLIK